MSYAQVLTALADPTRRNILESLRGAPRTHRLTRLPHVSRRSRRLLGPVDSFLVDG